MQGYFSQIVGRMEGAPKGSPLVQVAQKNPVSPKEEPFDPFSGEGKNPELTPTPPEGPSSQTSSTIQKTEPIAQPIEPMQQLQNPIFPQTPLKKPLAEKLPISAPSPIREIRPQSPMPIHFPEMTSKNKAKIEEQNADSPKDHHANNLQPTVANNPEVSSLFPSNKTPLTPIEKEKTEKEIIAVVNKETPIAPKTKETYAPFQAKAQPPKQVSQIQKLLPFENTNAVPPAQRAAKRQAIQKGLVIGSLKVEVLPPPSATVKTKTQKPNRTSGRTPNRTLGNNRNHKLKFGLGQI